MRKEHPRPQFYRKDWINLNGKWTCDFSKKIKGISKKKINAKKFHKKINVPFCVESKLSGIGHIDFVQEIWYHRKFLIPNNWKNQNIILHFGAVDYQTTIYVNQKKVGTNIGGSTPFSFDITKHIHPNKKQNDLVVYVVDKRCPGGNGSTPWYLGDGSFINLKAVEKWNLNMKRVQPRGKQSPHKYSWGCFYTRTTGIWQTVWLEACNVHALSNVNIVPKVNSSEFLITPSFKRLNKEKKLKIEILFNKKLVLSSLKIASSKTIRCKIKTPKLWSIEKPNLYKILFSVILNNKIIDKVESYAGLREITIKKNKIYLNNKPLYQRLVLDQGFYPDGIWTAPSDRHLKNDILLSMKAGFNGARLHEKVFEDRFHYWADKLGYITWAEFPNWGLNENAKGSEINFMQEWPRIVNYLKNHPSIITWTPFNETNTRVCNTQHKSLMRKAYNLTKKIDPSRPVNETSGYQHQKTDIWTVHNYEPMPNLLFEQLNPKKGVFRNFPQFETQYKGQPYIIDEYGGVWWLPVNLRKKIKSWGHGDKVRPKSRKEACDRMSDLTDVVLKTKHIQGFCYTQLTDIEQETNGIYLYDRKNKFNMKLIRKIFKDKVKKAKKNYLQ
jgi:beta-galactosidase/beta-glucuronidase